ncbi:hypothetical protein [Blautia producta]
MKRYSDWLTRMEEKYHIMFFRQDLPGYSEPSLGGFDGFARINRDDFSGGILGFFRHGSTEKTRKICLDGLPKDRLYRVLDMEGTEVTAMTGRQLEDEGFFVTIDEKFGGRLFEISGQF